MPGDARSVRTIGWTTAFFGPLFVTATRGRIACTKVADPASSSPCCDASNTSTSPMRLVGHTNPYSVPRQVTQIDQPEAAVGHERPNRMRVVARLVLHRLEVGAQRIRRAAPLERHAQQRSARGEHLNGHAADRNVVAGPHRKVRALAPC